MESPEHGAERQQTDPAMVMERLKQAEQLANGNSLTDALRVALTDPPINSKDQALKDAARDTVLLVLSKVRDDDSIDGILQSLTPDLHDTLLKYTYRGFAIGENGAQLLKWHAKLTEMNGVGAIIRAMTAKKTV